MMTLTTEQILAMVKVILGAYLFLWVCIIWSVFKLDRARLHLKNMAQIHTSEASRYQEMRLTINANFDQAILTTKSAVDGFNRIAEAMDSFVATGESGWKPAGSTAASPVNPPIPIRAPETIDSKGDGSVPDV